MATITITNGRQFAAQADETVLDAALRAGLSLPHGCKTGRCGSCKGQLQSGETTTKLPETSLTPAELSENWLLTCARTANTDLLIDIDDLGALNLPPVRTLPCRIQHLTPLGPDVLRVTLRLPPHQPLLFQAGQYVDVIGPDQVHRSYSIASAQGASRSPLPTDQEGGTPALSATQLELHVKRVPGGRMSDFWFERARPNDLLRLRGPQGSSVLHDVDGRALVMLATGTGIAPIQAMLESLPSMPAEQWPQRISLYWGARHAEDLYLDFLSLQDALPVPFSFIPVVSQDACWDGATGHVQDACIRAGHDFSRTVVYACGSEKMIASARTVLCAAGLPSRSFHSDAFVCSA